MGLMPVKQGINNADGYDERGGYALLMCPQAQVLLTVRVEEV